MIRKFQIYSTSRLSVNEGVPKQIKSSLNFYKEVPKLSKVEDIFQNEFIKKQMRKIYLSASDANICISSPKSISDRLKKVLSRRFLLCTETKASQIIIQKGILDTNSKKYYKEFININRY